MVQFRVSASANAEETEARRKVELVLLVELYGAKLNPRMGGELFLR